MFSFLYKWPAISCVPFNQKQKHTLYRHFWSEIAYLAQHQTFFVPKMSVKCVLLFLHKWHVRYFALFFHK